MTTSTRQLKMRRARVRRVRALKSDATRTRSARIHTTERALLRALKMEAV